MSKILDELKAARPVDFTDEELEMFLNPKHKKTLKSILLIKWSSIKLEIRMKIAGAIGFVYCCFKQNSKTTSQSPVYVEDLLQQKEFASRELLAAKHKHPFVHWLKSQKFFLIDFVETFVLKLRLWLIRLLH